MVLMRKLTNELDLILALVQCQLKQFFLGWSAQCVCHSLLYFAHPESWILEKSKK